MLSCSTDNATPILTCVHVNEAGFIEGSDGYRVMKTTLPKKMPIPTFLIPATVVSTLIKMNPVKVSSGTGWIHFKTELGTILSCRVFEEKYPDTLDLLKVEGTEFTFPRTINEILDRASVFGKQESGTLSDDVTVCLEKNRIKISSQSETGWFKEEANIEYKEAKLEFNIVPSLLRSILSSVLTCTFNGRILKFIGESWEFITLVKANV